MTDIFEAWVTDRVLLSCDGRVLELFGYVDAHRWHLAFRPTLEFSTKRSRLTVGSMIPGVMNFPYDPDRRADLEAFAARLVTAHL